MSGYRAKDKAPFLFQLVLEMFTNLFLFGSRKCKFTENPFQSKNILASKLILLEKQTSLAKPALAAASL